MTIARERRLEGHVPATRRELDRIEQQIQQNLLDRPFVDIKQRQIVADAGF